MWLVVLRAWLLDRVLRVLLEPVSAAGSTKISILMHTSVVEDE
jgi:hypothetical protein